MADEAPLSPPSAAILRGIDWRETFPFTHLFRSFWLAVNPSKLLLGLVLLLAVYLGGRTLDAMWPGGQKYWVPRNYGFTPYLVIAENLPVAGGTSHNAMPDSRLVGPFAVFMQIEGQALNSVPAAVVDGNWLGLNPLKAQTPPVLASAATFLVGGPLWLFNQHPVFGIVFFLWFLLVWSIFGGAIARLAAVHVARDETISIRQAMSFSTGKLLSFLFAPLIPILAVVLFGVAVGIGGLLLWVPYAGPIVLGALFFLALAAAFVVAMVIVGTVGGFSLMYPTIAVEGSDSFDAISRSLSYVFARPWRTLFYTAVAVGYGALTYLFIRWFVFLMLLATHLALGWFVGGQPAEFWNGTDTGAGRGNAAHAMIWPNPVGTVSDPHGGPALPVVPELSYDIDFGHLKWSEAISAWLISFWVYLLVGLVGAYVISFYFSANTIIYVLLRREVDATDLDDVYMEQADEGFAEPAAPAPLSAASAPTPATPPSEIPPPETPPT